jgi:DNA-binding NtrC family response regulator
VASQAIKATLDGVFGDSGQDRTTLQRHFCVLVVSSTLATRRPLLRTLETLCAEVISCSTQAQAEEVLSRQGIEIVFCDEQLADGSYYDLIHPNHWEQRIPRVVVTTQIGEWELYFEALGKGAFDTIRCPWYAAELEVIIIRALLEEDEWVSSRGNG